MVAAHTNSGQTPRVRGRRRNDPALPLDEENGRGECSRTSLERYVRKNSANGPPLDQNFVENRPSGPPLEPHFRANRSRRISLTRPVRENDSSGHPANRQW